MNVTPEKLLNLYCSLVALALVVRTATLRVHKKFSRKKFLRGGKVYIRIVLFGRNEQWIIVRMPFVRKFAFSTTQDRISVGSIRCIPSPLDAFHTPGSIDVHFPLRLGKSSSMQYSLASRTSSFRFHFICGFLFGKRSITSSVDAKNPARCSGRD
jgi:hypothetical protein